MNYLLDTNICIYIINKKWTQVIKKLEKLAPTQVAISSITAAELWFGVENSAHIEKNSRALHHFLYPIEILNFDHNAAKEYAQIRSQLTKKGQLIGPMNLLISAHARSLERTLVTNNTKEFSFVRGLKIENWI